MSPERARELLRRERERVERALAELRPASAGDEPADDDEQPADLGTETFDRELDESLAIRLGDELAAIDRAEERLAKGTYGLSVESGAAIPDGRLELIPWAERTAEEQSRYERAG
jgi:RNA polymerase-binding transcription factor